MVPDCNNKYMNLQLKQLPDGNYEILPFILICLELTKMLKPSGTIQFSKFLKFNKCIAPNNIGILVEHENGYLALASALEYNNFRVEQSDCIYGKMLVATKQNSTNQDSPKQPSQCKPNSSVACAVMGGKSIKTKKKKSKGTIGSPMTPPFYKYYCQHNTPKQRRG
jgi:hypothetical protein